MSKDRLQAVARQLDEMAPDGPSEMLALSEELAAIADAWPEPQIQAPPRMSRFQEEMHHLIEREVRDRMSGMRGYSEDVREAFLRLRYMPPDPVFNKDRGLNGIQKTV